jgi:hypothetical protein
MRVSRSTLLRLIRSLPDPPASGVEVLGVDEFAFRRRRNYGTVLVDLADGHRPIDIFDGHLGEDFAGWLRAHPSVKVICRDGSGGYADVARTAAPHAMQVADRWHLWDRLCQHVEKLVAAHHGCLPEPAVPGPDSGSDGEAPIGLAVLDRLPSVRAEHTRDRYRRIHALRDQGLSIQTIARRLDLNYKTARRYLRASNRC